MSETLLRETAFHPRIAPLVLSGQWGRWAGYVTVTCFEDVTHEYFAIRNAASLFDISPLMKYRVTGRDAARFVNRLLTRNIGKCAPGRACYGVWCDDEGKVVEDGTVFRLAANEFQINSQERNLCWFQDTALGLDVSIEDVSDAMAALALQGPLSRVILEELGLDGVSALRYFDMARLQLDNLPLLVTRTGFTGDLGYELWVEPEGALDLWDRLMEVGGRRGLTPIGSAALDYARIEAGLLQIDADFIGAELALRESQKRSPFELGFEWLVDLDKEHFVGKRALVAERRQGTPRRRVVGLEIVGNKPAAGAFVYAGRKEVGRTTSGIWSPILKKNIALATLDGAYAAVGTALEVDIWHPKELKIERIMAPCRVVRRPFYDP
ncbi:MAG: aminomethyltransferase family protein, partial [Alphaproteobacteria bacterium]